MRLVVRSVFNKSKGKEGGWVLLMPREFCCYQGHRICAGINFVIQYWKKSSGCRSRMLNTSLLEVTELRSPTSTTAGSFGRLPSEAQQMPTAKSRTIIITHWKFMTQILCSTVFEQFYANKPYLLQVALVILI